MILGYLIGVAVVMVLIWFGYAMGRIRDQEEHDRLRALRWVLHEEEPPGIVPPEYLQLQEDLVRAGWVHSNHVKDPEHFDTFGRYLYWGD